MSVLFLKILNMSIAASWLILTVIIIRPLLRKAPKRILFLLWAIIAVRLVFPFSIESIFSLIPSSETVPLNIELEKNPSIDSGIGIINNTLNPVILGSYSPKPAASANPLQIIIPVIAAIWLAGVVIMLSLALISYLRLKKEVAASILLRDNIMICDNIKSPFILGIIKPMIYLPSTLSEVSTDYVISHERAHIKRYDHLRKLFAYLLLSVYWFNPLCLLSYILICRDIETACDEEVIKDTDKDYMAAYSQALLDCSFKRKIITVCPLAFGEISVKQRVKGILNYKKPTFWIIFAAIVICVIISVCFLTNPKKSAVAFGDTKLYWAKTVDRRLDSGAIIKDLTIREIDDLESRLKELKVGEKDEEMKSLSPAFSIMAYSKEMGAFNLEGFNGDGKAVRLLYNGECYSIDDEEFEEYLSNICADLDINNSKTFIGVITEISGETILIEPSKQTSEAKSSDSFSISVNDIRSVSKPKPGDILEITYNGEILEIYPARFGEVYSVKIIGNIEHKVDDLTTLKEKYPEYFDLPTFKGLEVYVWQMSAESYYCGLLPGTDREKTEYELVDLKGVGISEMKEILSTYNIPEDEIAVIPCNHPLSSYYRQEIDDEYKKVVRDMFFGK